MGLDPNSPVRLRYGDVQRIAAGNRAIERFDRAKYNGSVVRSRQSADRTTISVRITEAASGGTPDIYPAVVLEFSEYNGAASVWVDLAGSECWVVPGPDGGELAVGSYRDAQLVGEFNGLPVFSVEAPAALKYPYPLGKPCIEKITSSGYLTDVMIRQVYVINADLDTECVEFGDCCSGSSEGGDDGGGGGGGGGPVEVTITATLDGSPLVGRAVSIVGYGGYSDSGITDGSGVATFTAPPEAAPTVVVTLATPGGETCDWTSSTDDGGSGAAYGSFTGNSIITAATTADFVFTVTTA